MNKLNQRISGLILMIVGIGILWVAYAETQPKGVELLRRGRPWHLAVIFLLIFGLGLLSLVLKKRNTQTVDSSISKQEYRMVARRSASIIFKSIVAGIVIIATIVGYFLLKK